MTRAPLLFAVTIVSLLGFWLAGSRPALAFNSECHIQGDYDFSGRGPWPMILQVPPGGCHRLSFKSGGQMRFTKLFVERAPTRGKLTLHEGGYYSYVGNPGFHGSDAFQLDICRINRRQVEQCVILAFEVRVQ